VDFDIKMVEADKIQKFGMQRKWSKGVLEILELACVRFHGPRSFGETENPSYSPGYFIPVDELLPVCWCSKSRAPELADAHPS
jgi:hypothetical protein